ncbi:MAG: SHOCT domain-containing protein, partial [Holophagae bacterium]|nr:SHOCT domain-containing protein [Holophagae bacterium]
VEGFKTLKKNQQLKIVKTWKFEREDGKFHEDRSICIYLCFTEPDTLYVALLYKNWEQEEVHHLIQGSFMKWMERKDGKLFLNIVLMDRSLWTENFNKPVFDRNLDFNPDKIKQTINKNTDQKGNIKDNKTEKAEPVTLTFEQLEKELKRLNGMKDKGLISEEEYKKARARLMTQAGIGK